MLGVHCRYKPERRWSARFVNRTAARMSSFEPQGLVMLSWGASRMQLDTPPVWRDQLLDACGVKVRAALAAAGIEAIGSRRAAHLVTGEFGDEARDDELGSEQQELDFEQHEREQWQQESAAWQQRGSAEQHRLESAAEEVHSIDSSHGSNQARMRRRTDISHAARHVAADGLPPSSNSLQAQQDAGNSSNPNQSPQSPLQPQELPVLLCSLFRGTGEPRMAR